MFKYTYIPSIHSIFEPNSNEFKLRIIHRRLLKTDTRSTIINKL